MINKFKPEATIVFLPTLIWPLILNSQTIPIKTSYSKFIDGPADQIQSYLKLTPFSIIQFSQKKLDAAKLPKF
jgi:hypothetical protein